jgi:hypothetical protein
LFGRAGLASAAVALCARLARPSTLCRLAGMPKSTAHAPSSAGSAAAPAIPAAGDSLARAAAVCGRHHVRYARVVEHDTSEAEQRAVCKMAELADELLQEMARAYERAAAEGGPDEPWWHRANLLLMASRDFLRHQDRCDKATRLTGARSHSVADLDALTAGYELEASALLALQQALDAYRKARPEAELRSNGHRPGA